MGFAHSYADAILRRGRVPMEPATFVPDWSDRPRKWKHYPGVESYPLPEAAPTRDGRPGTVHDGLFGDDTDQPFDLPALGGMLRDCYGLVGRRLGIQSNTDMAGLPSYRQANWHRGAASGGGLYPVTVYWVAGAGGPLQPGVYHYAPHQHALRPLLVGGGAEEVRTALGGSEHEQFLVLGVKYWQNAFKYNSFCFHAVSMDVGAAAQALRVWARSAGMTAAPHLFFDETAVARLLGVDDDEGIFAVVPLRWEGRRAEASTVEPARPAGVGVRHRDAERSRTVLTFEMVRRMQEATRQDGPGAPAPGSLAAATIPARVGDASLPLPADGPVTVPMRTALRRRRSSFGRFDARTPLAADALGTSLAAAAAAAADLAPAPGLGSGLVGLHVFVNHVDGVAPGTYSYSGGRSGGRLLLLDAEPPGAFLQRNYFLSNYNLEQAGVVVVPTMRTSAVLDAVGDRGYRLVNATIGAIAQNVYVAAAALGVGCGVALGFDNVSYVERLGLTDGEVPLLLMMLGVDRPGSADFRYEIA